MAATLRRLPALAGLAALAAIGAPLAGHRAFTRARDHRVFTGRLVRKHLSFPDRAVASAIRAAEGDFRNWAETREWAASIADALLA